MKAKIRWGVLKNSIHATNTLIRKKTIKKTEY